ncbi:MAG: hypothetical protein D8M59_16210 [Planctomycetes bacterium]|nr:hypothetical protein [Planctomycetota bacterium]NOG52745.1 hypothetical protein [Planctomycetota bacterium]
MNHASWKERNLSHCCKVLSAAAVVSLATSTAVCMAAPPDLGDGYSLGDRFEAYRALAIPGNEQEHPTTGREMIIIDRTRPVALFAMYRASQMTAPGWDMYDRCVSWANDHRDPATTKVWLATYNGTLDPGYSAELDGIAIYNYLTGTMGFNPANVTVAHQSTIETASFAGYDIVIYAWSYPRDATNVVSQNMPFVTCSAGESDELGIGDGTSSMHESRDYGYVVNNGHFVTKPYSVGMFTLATSMWMDATGVSGNGVALVSADNDGYTGMDLTTADSCPGFMTLDVSNCTPGNNIYFIYGTTTGPGPFIPGCAGMLVDILSPKIAGASVANAAGDASFGGSAPSAACGKIVVQAVDKAACMTSTLLFL